LSNASSIRFLQSPQLASTAKEMVTFLTGLGPANPMLLSNIIVNNKMLCFFICVFSFVYLYLVSQLFISKKR
jgi:TctA family transporter